MSNHRAFVRTWTPATLGVLAGILSVTPAFAQGGVLSLDEALQSARTNQPQLRAAGAQTRQVTARVGEARSVYLPRVDAQAQYQRSTPNFLLSPMMLHTPLTKGYQAQNELALGDSVDYYTFGIMASQLIYDFGKASGGIAQVEATEQASQADERATAQTTATNVRVAYYGVLAAQQLVAVGEETVRNQQKHAEQVRRFVNAGQRTRFDLSSVELNYSNAQIGLVRARNVLGLAKIRLKTAIGIDGAADFSVVEPNPAASVFERRPAGELIAEAEQHRPELRRADAQLRAQRAGGKAARAGYLPSISALGGVAAAKGEGFGAGYDWFVGIGLNWNLFNGMYTTNQTAEARAGEDLAAAQRENARQAIVADVEEQRLAIDDAQARGELAERTVATASERLAQAEHRYETGAGDVLELDDAQIMLTNAKAQSVQARYDLAIARARLARALGQAEE
jgi:outer membrane protein TolC